MKTMNALGHRLAGSGPAGWRLLASTAAMAADAYSPDLPSATLDPAPCSHGHLAEQKQLHYMMLRICTAIFVAVFVMSLFHPGKSPGHQPATSLPCESVKVEIAWTVVPFLIVIGMVLPATKAVVA